MNFVSPMDTSDEKAQWKRKGESWRHTLFAPYGLSLSLRCSHFTFDITAAPYYIRCIVHWTAAARTNAPNVTDTFVNTWRSFVRRHPDSSRRPLAPEPKRFKKNEDLFSRFEEDHPLNNNFIQQDDCGSDSDEYDFDIKQSDELDLYLVIDIDRSSLSNDPLAFWRSHTDTPSCLIWICQANSFNPSNVSQCWETIFRCWLGHQRSSNKP